MANDESYESISMKNADVTNYKVETCASLDALGLYNILLQTKYFSYLPHSEMYHVSFDPLRIFWNADATALTRVSRGLPTFHRLELQYSPLGVSLLGVFIEASQGWKNELSNG